MKRNPIESMAMAKGDADKAKVELERTVRREGVGPFAFEAVMSLTQCYWSQDQWDLASYAEGAPHLVHEQLFVLLRTLVKRAMDACPGSEVRMLDLGAGEGSVARLWLCQNAKLTAVDLSSAMLTQLQAKCAAQANHLRCVTMDASEYLAVSGEQFDVVSCISLLHHIPDYVGLIRLGLRRVKPSGVLVTFADPIRYDTLRIIERLFGELAYGIWRLRRPDVLEGIGRRLRRMRGIYLDDSIHDNVEYHITRAGVDQDAIAKMLQLNGMQVEVHRYWSTQSALFQRLGTLLGLENSFGIFAQKC